jgi:glycogen operon protein
MLTAGDEVGNSQGGNNNAYCQDNPTGWVDWSRPGAAELATFVERLIAVRRAHPVLRQTRFLHATRRPSDGWPDVSWVAPNGREAKHSDWQTPSFAAFGMVLRGASLPHAEPDGNPILILVNATLSPLAFHLPKTTPGHGWRAVLTTATADGTPLSDVVIGGGKVFNLDQRCLVLLAEAALPHGHSRTRGETS